MILRIVDAWKTVETDGYKQKTPIVHVVGRDRNLRRHHIPIEGFRPYFLVRESEWVEVGEQIASDDRVLDVKTEDRRGRLEESIDGEQLYRVVCREPSDVDDLREAIDDPFEADVLFPVRFLVDYGIFQWMEVPDECVEADGPVSEDEVTLGLDEERKPDETPPLRTCVYDIEVQQGGNGPPVVSERGTEQARNPITAITAHDSYTDEYKVWVLAHKSWDAEDSETARGAVDCDVSVYGNPQDVVSFFLQWVVERDFDALIAWNGSGFDHPYFVNWAMKNNVSAVYDLSPTNDVYSMSGDGSWINSSLKGRLLLDLLEMYKKTEIHELDSYRLADVATENDVSVGKLSIEDELDVPDSEPAIDYAWANDPETFVEYSYRDVAAAVGINKESKENVNIL